MFRAIKSPIAAPKSCATINAKIDSGAIPVIDVVNTRPIVIAGFAKAVLEVSNIPPNIQSGTYKATRSSRFGNRRIIQSNTAVAITSETNKLGPLRRIIERLTIDWSKIKLAVATPEIAPKI